MSKQSDAIRAKYERDSKASDGPWEINGRKVFKRGEGTIAIIPGPDTEGVFRWLANAKLIAAAPDLFRALQDLSQAVDEWDHHPELLDAARAAIARAEGRS